MRLSAARALALSLAVAPLGLAIAQPSHAVASGTRAATAPAVAPTATPAPVWSGVYRISLTRGGESVPARVLMERVGDALYGTFLLDNVASALGRVQGSETEFRASVVITDGRGELVLRPTATGIVGTLTVGKTTWEVRGERSA